MTPSPVWREIESAPKDGTEFLAWVTCGTFDVAWPSFVRWLTDRWISETDGVVNPVAWVPLSRPAPPPTQEQTDDR
jgi:hypothetical protein